MADKVTISKKIDKDTVMVVEVDTTHIGAVQGMKEAAEALALIEASKEVSKNISPKN